MLAPQDVGEIGCTDHGVGEVVMWCLLFSEAEKVCRMFVVDEEMVVVQE